MTEIASKNSRNMTLDVLKGLGIILMVWVHGGGPFGHFINLFHMPIFFIASGFLWNEENAVDFQRVIQYIKRKFVSLWKPFVLFNGILVLLHNLFLKIGFYTSSPEIFDFFSTDTNRIQYAYSVKKTVQNLLKTIVLASTPQLGVPTWFIRTLFIVTISFAVVSYADKKLLHSKVITCCTFCVSGLAATLISVFSVQLPMGGSNVCAAWFLYVVGVQMNALNSRINILREDTKTIRLQLLISFMVLLICNQMGTVAFSSGKITNIFFLLVASIAGWYLLYSLAVVLPVKIKRYLSYIGKHSIAILLFHLLCFKLVSIIYTIVTCEKWVYVAAFPSIKGVTALWIAYLIIGIAGPLLLDLAYKKLKCLLWRN